MRLDSVSKIPTTTAVVTTVSVKKTQYIHTETTNTMHDKIYPVHTRLSQRVEYSVNLYTIELIRYYKTLTYQKIRDQTKNPKWLTQFPLYRLKQN